MWTTTVHYIFFLSLRFIAPTYQQLYAGSFYSELKGLLSSLSSAADVSESQILDIINPDGGSPTNSKVFRDTVAQEKLFALLQVLSHVVGRPLQEGSLSGLLTTSRGQNEQQDLVRAIQNSRQRIGCREGGDNSDYSKKETYDDAGTNYPGTTITGTNSADSRARQKRNQGVLVPISSNSGFVPLSRGGQQRVESSIFRPQEVDSSRNRGPTVIDSSGDGSDRSLQPIPTSIFDRPNSNRRQPIFIFTRLDSTTGGIITPNLIFRVNYTAGRPVHPYLLTHISTGIAQPTLKSLLNILNANSNGPQEPVYLLSRLNETSGMPTPPYLVFHANPRDKQPEAPYVLSRLQLSSGRPTQPEILQYLDSETGQPIVQQMLPLLHSYTA